MIWSKRDELDSIKQVVSRNSGMTEEELMKSEWDTQIMHLYDVADYLCSVSIAERLVSRVNYLLSREFLQNIRMICFC